MDALTESSRDSPLYSSFSLDDVVLVRMQVRKVDTRWGAIDGSWWSIFVVVILKTYFFRSFLSDGNVRTWRGVPKVDLKVDVLWVFR